LEDLNSTPIKYVLDSDGVLHQIDYNYLVNLPSELKNPYSIVIFGQTYDGSKQIEIIPSAATESSFGCIKASPKTEDMTKEIYIGKDGKLYTDTQEIVIDKIVS
jgi:hypothetical protein